jgi:hypothetical protein
MENSGDATSRRWKVLLKAGRMAGPYDWNQLRALAKSGRLSQEMLVIADDGIDWIPASRIPSLFDAEHSEPAPAADHSSRQVETNAGQDSAATDPSLLARPPAPKEDRSEHRERWWRSSTHVTHLLLIALLLAQCDYRVPQWEYRIDSVPDAALGVRMDVLGSSGWEAFSSRRATSDDGVPIYEIMYRRRRN